jgi:predicted hotdog family 3-hydroxylacyl-ACP dehydratase
MIERPLPPVAEILPQRGRMMLLSSVLEHSEDQTVCAVEVGADTPFVEAGGTVPAVMGVEYMAQCVAAHAGLQAWARGESPRVGFLIGSRRLDFWARSGFRVGQRLIVRVTHTWGEEEYAMFACQLTDGTSQEILVEGNLNVFLPRSLEAFRALPR